MVLQNDRLTIAEVLRDPAPLFTVKDNTAELRVDGVASPEACAILCHDVELPSEDGKGFAINGVSMTGCVDIRAGFMDFGVNGKSCGVNRLISNDYLTLLIDEDKIADADLGEMHAMKLVSEYDSSVAS